MLSAGKTGEYETVHQINGEKTAAPGPLDDLCFFKKRSVDSSEAEQDFNLKR